MACASTAAFPAGDGTDRDQRDYADNTTILSGDLNNDDVPDAQGKPDFSVNRGITPITS